jgi:hypothetical protein
VRQLDRRPDLADGERRGLPVRPVEVELDQVGAVVELPGDRGRQCVAVVDLDAEPARQPAGSDDPGPGGADVRVVAVAGPAVPDAEREGAHAAVDRIDSGGGADVAGPADAGRAEQPRVVLSRGDQPVR